MTRNKFILVTSFLFIVLIFFVISYFYNWRGSEISIPLGKIDKIVFIKPGFENSPYSINDKNFIREIKQRFNFRPFYNITFKSFDPKSADYEVIIIDETGYKYEIYYWQDNKYISFNDNIYIPYEDITNLLDEKINNLERSLSPAVVQATKGYSDEEKLLIALINLERKKNRLKPLVISMKLTRLARMKSQDLVNLDYLGNNSPTFGNIFEMLEAANLKFQSAGENIVASNTPEGAFKLMMQQKGQKALILSKNFNRFGVGLINGGKYGRVFTLILIEE